MKIDISQSVYHEADTAKNEFADKELKHLRWLLRRLRFLEFTTNQKSNDISAESAESALAEREIEALAWTLTEIGFLPERHAEVKR